VRLVLDTNVVVSALVFGGTPVHLLQAAVTGDVLLFTSPILLAELRKVLARPHLAAPLARKQASVDQAIAKYGELALRVSPLTVPRIVERDPDDDHVIACALAARADAIISGDRHLLDLGEHQGIAILSAADALTRLA
jgi:putative PIN family toxin of toxin-antitoxin system